MRNVRRHARQELEALEKDGEISEDELERAEKELEKLTHEVVAEIDDAARATRSRSCSRSEQPLGSRCQSGCQQGRRAERRSV